MKRLLCFILVLLLLIPSAMADEQKMTFRLEDAKGNVGDTVTVIGSVENAPACASFRVIFTYDNKVLKPEKVKKLDCGGLFMSNTSFVYQGKSAINVLSADSKKSFEGNVQLFSITFTILAESPETDGSPLTLVHKEFFDPSTPKPLPIQPNVEIGCVYVGDDKPAAPDAGNDGSSSEGNTGSNEGSTTPSNPDNTDKNEGSTTPSNPGSNEGSTTPSNPGSSTEDGSTGSAGDGDTSVSNPTDTPADGTTDQPENDTPVDGTPEIAPGDQEGVTAPETEKDPAGDPQPEEEDKTPTGSWIVDPETEDIYHITEEGEETVFEPEYVEKPEPGKVTEVILKDKETGKEAGSIKVEGNEDGSFEVIEQDVPSLREPSNQTGNASKGKIWVWVGIGGGALALAGIALWAFFAYRKLK